MVVRAFAVMTFAALSLVFCASARADTEGQCGGSYTGQDGQSYQCTPNRKPYCLANGRCQCLERKACGGKQDEDW